MKILIVSDEESPYLWDYYTPGRLAGIDMILSAGDLKASYLSFLVTMANRPLLYVPGNHDAAYAAAFPANASGLIPALNELEAAIWDEFCKESIWDECVYASQMPDEG